MAKRLDVYFGEEVMAWLEGKSQASGRSKAELIKAALQNDRLRDSEIKDQVRQAVLDLAAAVEPDEQYDPADDPREPAAVLRLAVLLGSLPAAEGVAEALTILWVRWKLGQED